MKDYAPQEGGFPDPLQKGGNFSSAGREADEAVAAFLEARDEQTESYEETGLPIGSEPLIDERTKSFWKNALGAARRHKTKLIVGSAVAALGYQTITGSTDELLEDIRQAEPWVWKAWSTSVAAYIGSGVTMLAAAGSKVRNPFKIKNEMPLVAEKLRSSPVVKTSFGVNLASGIGAGVFAAYGIVETLPPSAWGSLFYPAADIYSTVAIRAAAYKYIKDKR